MKKLNLFIACLLLASIVFSQENKDVVYLKNGSVVKGIITEPAYNQHIKTTTSDGNIFVFKYSEIKKMTKEAEEINFDDGGQYSYGIAIGEGGLVGLPFRYYINPKVAIEAGAYFRSVFSLADDKINTFSSTTLAGRTNLYLSKFYNLIKEKIILNGLSFKAGYSFGDYPESMFAVGWAHEFFKKKNKKQSFIFEFGAGAPNYFSDNYYQIINDNLLESTLELVWEIKCKDYQLFCTSS